MGKLLLTVAETAAETGLGEWAVRGGIARGDIPAKRFGRNFKVPRWWIEAQRSGTPADRNETTGAV